MIVLFHQPQIIIDPLDAIRWHAAWDWVWAVPKHLLNQRLSCSVSIQASKRCLVQPFIGCLKNSNCSQLTRSMNTLTTGIRCSSPSQTPMLQITRHSKVGFIPYRWQPVICDSNSRYHKVRNYDVFSFLSYCIITYLSFFPCQQAISCSSRHPKPSWSPFLAHNLSHTIRPVSLTHNSSLITLTLHWYSIQRCILVLPSLGESHFSFYLSFRRHTSPRLSLRECSWPSSIDRSRPSSIEPPGIDSAFQTYL